MRPLMPCLVCAYRNSVCAYRDFVLWPLLWSGISLCGPYSGQLSPNSTVTVVTPRTPCLMCMCFSLLAYLAGHPLCVLCYLWCAVHLCCRSWLMLAFAPFSWHLQLLGIILAMVFVLWWLLWLLGQVFLTTWTRFWVAGFFQAPLHVILQTAHHEVCLGLWNAFGVGLCLESLPDFLESGVGEANSRHSWY